MTPIESRLRTALSDSYRLERELGQGGMATVYLALDLKHHRQVALKVLHPDLAAVLGADRFLSEIRTTANLQHPHILPLHDSGHADGLLYYVMPFVEGETLRARLARERQLPVEEAVRITKEVASALDYAHRHGVIHRDIKPENILLHEGQALIADFGIALAVTSAGETRMTQTGMSLGTPEYMSPEQALGERSITARSDVYALGCVLYEMLTGEPPFTGTTVQAIVARVLNEEPRPVRQVRKTVPPHVEATALHALGKLPADRFESAAEFAAALGNAAFATVARPAPGSAVVAPGRYRVVRWWQLAIVGVAFLLLTSWGWRRGARPPAGAVQHIPVELSSPIRVRSPWAVTAKLSPDGRLIGYHSGGGRFFVLDLTTGANRPVNPNLPPGLNLQFSPRSDSLVYRTQSWNGQLYVVSLATGQGRMIADSTLSHELGWSDDGWIYFGDMAGGLSRVRPDGTGREQLIPADPTGRHHVSGAIAPLPGGRGVLFAWTLLSNSGSSPGQIVALDLKTRRQTPLLEGVDAVYSPTGHLVVVQANRTAVAAPFDPSSLAVGGPFRTVQDSIEAAAGFYLKGSLSLATTGDALYISTAASSSDELVWVDRSGAPVGGAVGSGGWANAADISGDGSRLAISVHRGGRGNVPNIWVAERQEAGWRRLTFGDILDYMPFFIEKGNAVAFVSPRAGQNWDLYRVPWDGSADASVMLDAAGDIQNPAFRPDGQWVAYCERDLQGQTDLMAHRFGPDSASIAIAGTPAVECLPAFSPDGKWLAYASDESGRNEVYVVPFPVRPGARWQVSTAGGNAPAWSRDGRELYFRASDDRMMAADIVPGASFSFRAARELFRAGDLAWLRRVHPVTGNFLMARQDLRAPGRVVLVRNWTARLQEVMASPP